jgi:hypothetical protein
VILTCCLEKGVKINSNVFLFVSFPPLYLHAAHLHRLENKIAIGRNAKVCRDNLILTFGFLGGGEELEKGYTFFLGKSRSHFKILGPRKMTRNKFLFEGSPLLDTKIQSSVTLDI